MQREPTNAPNTRLQWRSTDPALRAIDALRLVGGLSLYFAACLLACGLIAFALVSVAVLLRGEDWLAIAAGWLDPELWLGGALLSVGLSSTLLPWMLLFRDVEAFCFDSDTQMLETVERRAWFSPQTCSRPFSAIQSVLPVHSGSCNMLLVDVLNARGKTQRLELGKGLPLATIEAYARWLAPHLGDRLRPTHVYSD